MARELSTPLTAEDLEWLGERLPDSHIERLIALHGAEGVEASSEAESVPEDGEGAGGTEDLLSAANGSEEEDEDLIGDSFDPSDHTEAEIKDHLEANPADHDRVLAAEAEGRQRKGVLAL